MTRVVHYVNQFFGGLGGEDQADAQPQVKEGSVGPGRLLGKLLGEDIEVVATVVCGDNTAASGGAETCDEVVRLAQEAGAEYLVAGPAFQSGRYGLACAGVAAAVVRAGMRGVVSMNAQNPGLAMCPVEVPVVRAGENAMDMKASLERLVPVVRAVTERRRLTREERALCVPRDIRRNVFDERPAALRSVEMLLRKVRGEPFESEVPRPRFPAVTPAPPAPEGMRLAFVTTGGLVPRGNPDGLESSSATKWFRYSLSGMSAFDPEDWEVHHAGIDTTQMSADPNRLLPLDVCRDIESEGVIGELLPTYFTTVGNLTPVALAQEFGKEMAARLKSSAVDAVLLTST